MIFILFKETVPILSSKMLRLFVNSVILAVANVNLLHFVALVFLLLEIPLIPVLVMTIISNKIFPHVFNVYITAKLAPMPRIVFFVDLVFIW
jgi:hypothetical protein